VAAQVQRSTVADSYTFPPGPLQIRHYTADENLHGTSRKRQAAIDAARLLDNLYDRLQEYEEISADETQDISNVANEFKASLPKADRDELREG